MTTAAERLAERFEQAERAGVWLTASGNAEELSLCRGRREGRYISPCRGMFARDTFFRSIGARERTLRTMRTLSVLHPHWVFCSFSAAVLHGLQVPNRFMGNVHISQRHVTGSRPDGSKPLVVRHRPQVDDAQVVTVLGMRATSLRRTVVDCLCQADFRSGLAIADSAIHWGLTSRAEIGAWLAEDGRRRRGVVQARETVKWTDGRSDNGGESIVRAIVIELGFEVPWLQVEIFDPLEPNNPKFGDMGWKRRDGRWVILELDGLGKYRPDRKEGLEETVRTLTDERRREAHINLSDVIVIRVSFSEALDTAYFDRLLRAAGVPRRR